MSIEFYLGFLVFVLVIGIAVAIHFLLRTKKALFSKNQMFDSTGELMFILDRNGCVQEVNSIVIELLGMDREEVLNLNFTTFLDFNQEVVTDELLQKFSVKHFMEQFSFVDKIVSLDIHLLNKIHHRLPVLLSGKKIYSLEGELDGYVISARDMRFQKEKQMQVIQTSKMTSIHALTAGVAHEINNPLMILRGNVEILKMCLPDAVAKNEKIVKILNKQFSAVERIVRIVSGLRDYSRPRNDTVHVFDANKIIENSLDI